MSPELEEKVERLADEVAMLRILLSNVVSETNEDAHNGYITDLQALGYEGLEGRP